MNATTLTRTALFYLSVFLSGRAYADVTLNGFAGGNVVYASVPVTLPSTDYFTVSLDGGSTGTAAPSSLSVSPTAGYTDATVVIAGDPSNLQAGNVVARLVFTFPGGEPTAVQNVTFAVTSAAPKLEVLPAAITLSGVNNDSFPVSLPVFIRNAGGGGPQPFTASLLGGALPFLALTAASGNTNQNSPGLTIQDTGTAKANTGAYYGLLHISSGSLSQDVPVTFLAKPDLLFFSVSQTGLYFTAQQGVGTPEVDTISILVASTAVEWTASVLSAQDFVTVSPTSATVTPAGPGQVNIGVKPLSTPGTYYATVSITPTGFSNSISPVSVTVVYTVTATAPPPVLQPAGLVFASASGITSPASQSVNVVASSTMALPYEVGVAGDFIDVANVSGSASGSALTPVAVSVSPAGLNPGIYRGQVQFNFAPPATYLTADVLQIVLPAGVAAPTSALGTVKGAPRTVTGCTPTQIAVIGTSVAGNFSQPASWPIVVQTRVVDDCANPVTNAKVVLSFSNGDPPLTAPLEATSGEQGGNGGSDGTYAATWIPAHPGAVTTTVLAVAGAMSGTAIYTGTVTPNSAPTLTPNGTVNNLYIQPGAPLAPGTVTAIYGSGMAGGSPAGQPSQIPLPITFLGTSVAIGGLSAPFYYVSDGQLDVQLPAELNPNQSYQLVVSSNGAITVPQTITIGSETPGVAALSDGQLIAQHLDYTLVDSGHPAKAGETLIMYLDGMGATNPPVATNTVAPSLPLAEVINAPTVTVDGNQATIVFAGLTPGGIGLYQIDFTVPANARSGNLAVAVTQNGTAANATTMPVASQ